MLGKFFAIHPAAGEAIARETKCFQTFRRLARQVQLVMGMNPKNCTIFALGLLAGTAVTLYALPIARREAQRKSTALANKIAHQIEDTVSETSGKTREGLRKISENIATQKQAVVDSVTAAKQAYRDSVALNA